MSSLLYTLQGNSLKASTLQSYKLAITFLYNQSAEESKMQWSSSYKLTVNVLNNQQQHVTNKKIKNSDSHLFIKCRFETQIARTHKEFLKCLGTWLRSRFLGSICQLTNSQLDRVALVRLVIGTISNICWQLIVDPTWLVTRTDPLYDPHYRNHSFTLHQSATIY